MKNYKDLNDYEIVYMVRERDEDATKLLFEKYKPIVLNLAKEYYRIGKKYGLELDDFIQEGNFALFCAIKNYTEEKNSLFYTYATISIRSKMKNLIVRNTTDKNVTLNQSISLFTEISDKASLIDCLADDKAVLPELEAEITEYFDKLKEFIYALPFEEALTFELKINGFNTREISTLLAKSENAVCKILYGVKKKLKNIR